MLTHPAVVTALLPCTDKVRLETITHTADQITASLVAIRPTVACPQCGTLTTRIHSHYVRTLADLPWSQLRVRLHLTVRKFRCPAPSCPRQVFTERLPEVAAPSARRTTRLTELVLLVGAALGGAAGARLLARLGLTASRPTLLRLLRRATMTVGATPRVLGVDDWALRKGHTYGTILIDHERHQVIDLLPDRAAETFAAWLRQHPGVERITRDRAPAYADGARQGAPDAVQIADRWHLLRNLSEALEEVLLQHRAALRAAVAAVPTDPEPAAAGPLTPHRPRWRVQRHQEVSRQRHARLVEQYETIHRLAAAGATANDIARQLGVHRRTVYRYRALAEPPAPRQLPRSPRRRVLTPYEPYLLQRWQEGCRVGMRLFRELREQGYPYGASNVMRFVATLRREEAAGHPPGSRQRAAPRPVPTARHVAALLLRRPEKRTDEEQAYLTRLRERDATVATMAALTDAFTTLVRERGGARLEEWLGRAETEAPPPLQRFARGVRADLDAVRTGLTEAWSNGPTEGHVNKLKLVKRQMYGRAKFDLLRQRVLMAS